MYDEQLHRVSPRARVMWAVGGIVRGAGLLAVAIGLAVTGVVVGPWDWLLIAFAALVLVLGATIEPWWRYRVHEWGVTRDSVVTQRGWLTLERREAPLNRVQTVDIERGPLAQIFGLSEVTVTTASARGHLRIEGLEQHMAERLVRDLTARATLIADDAT